MRLIRIHPQTVTHPRRAKGAIASPLRVKKLKALLHLSLDFQKFHEAMLATCKKTFRTKKISLFPSLSSELRKNVFFGK